MKSSGSASHAHSSHVTNAVDDSAEDYQPSAFESEHDQGEAANSGTSMEHTRLTHRKMTNAEKEAKQRRLEGQVGFIILTRDNNKPNAYGMCSVTHAPLPWSAVARAYNEKYGVSVTPAAMEKRVRQHRTDWMAKHPAYPVKIVYAHKTRKSQAPRSKANVAKAPAHRARNIVETDVHSNRGTDRHQKCVEAIGYLDSSDRIAGWLPPDHVRNQADIRNYIDDARSVDSCLLTIEVIDSQETSLGSVTIDCEDVRRSSLVFRRLLVGMAGGQTQLYGPSVKTVQHYVHCVSSKSLTEFLDCEACDRISLIELYCFATQLEDEHVRWLVMDRWELLSDQHATVEIALEDLNLLFASTGCADPARMFWVETLCAAGLADQLLGIDGYDSALTARVQSLVANEAM